MNPDGKVTIDVALNDKQFKKELNNIKKQSNSTFSFFKKGIGDMSIGSAIALKAVGAGFRMVGDAAKAAGTYIMKVGQDFEYEMAKVQAISGATGEELEKLNEKAKEMGKNTVFSASESAEALKYMAMAGWETNDMLSGIEGVMDLAAASGEDLATVSDIVTDAITAFGLSAKDTGHFVDVLAKASSSSNTNVAMMGETFKYVAPIAGALGYSINDTALAVGLMANAGVKSSRAGTALRGSLTRMVKPTKQAKDALMKLGLAGTDVTVSTKALDKAQDKAAKSSKKYEEALIKYDKALSKYGEGSEQAAKALERLNKAQEQSNEAKQFAENTKVAVSEVYKYNKALIDENGEMRTLKDTMTILRDAFKGLSKAEKAEYAALLFGQEAMSGMLAIVNATDEDFEKLSSEIDGASGAAKEMANTLNNTYQGAVKKAKSATEALALTIFDKLKHSAKDGVSALAEEIANLDTVLNEKGADEFIQALVDLVVRGINAFSQSVIDNSDRMVDSGLDLVLALLKGIGLCLPKLIIAGGLLITKIIIGIVDRIPDIIKAAIKVTTNFIGEIIRNLPEIVLTGMKLITSLIMGTIKAAPRYIWTIGKLCKDIIKEFLSVDWIQIGKDIIDGIKEGILRAWENLKEKLSNIVDSIKGFFKGASEVDIPGPKAFSPDPYSSRYSGNWNTGTNNYTINNNMTYNSTGSTYRDARTMSREVGRLTEREMRAKGLATT